jgi:predicted dehydrogenase
VTTIGICGIGSIGARHARVFAQLPDVQIVVYDPVADATAMAARLTEPARVVSTFEELLEAAPSGVVIASPDAHHREQTELACESGVPVLLEKPIAHTVDDGVAILDAVTRTRTPVLVGYVLHHFRCLQRAHDLIADGALGTPVSFQLMLGSYETLRVARNRFTADTWGTLFVDYSHEWDYLRWLLHPVAGGFALARTAGQLPLTQQPNVIDAVLRLSDGTTGTAHLDYVQDPGSRRFTIVGDRATLQVDVGTGLIRLERGESADPLEELFTELRDEAFTRQAVHFLDVVGNAAEPVVSAAHGLAALTAADLLRRSAVENRWVDAV